MKNKILGLSAIVILVIITAVYFKNIPHLPKAFSIHMVTDNTSSGGSRTTTADLTYGNSFLVKGSATHIADETSGMHIEYTCTYTNNMWTDIKTQKACLNIPNYPTTVKSLKAQIKNKTILPADENCGHFDTCFSIDTGKGFSFDV